jgi:hypothetical protein
MTMRRVPFVFRAFFFASKKEKKMSSAADLTWPKTPFSVSDFDEKKCRTKVVQRGSGKYTYTILKLGYMNDDNELCVPLFLAPVMYSFSGIFLSKFDTLQIPLSMSATTDLQLVDFRPPVQSEIDAYRHMLETMFDFLVRATFEFRKKLNCPLLQNFKTPDAMREFLSDKGPIRHPRSTKGDRTPNIWVRLLEQGSGVEKKVITRFVDVSCRRGADEISYEQLRNHQLFAQCKIFFDGLIFLSNGNISSQLKTTEVYAEVHEPRPQSDFRPYLALAENDTKSDAKTRVLSSSSFRTVSVKADNDSESYSENDSYESS